MNLYITDRYDLDSEIMEQSKALEQLPFPEGFDPSKYTYYGNNITHHCKYHDKATYGSFIGWVDKNEEFKESGRWGRLSFGVKENVLSDKIVNIKYWGGLTGKGIAHGDGRYITSKGVVTEGNWDHGKLLN